MQLVIVTPAAPGLGVMLGDLVGGNLEAHPERRVLLSRARGRINIRATDADVEAGLSFTGGQLTIGSALEGPDIAIATDSETLLSLTTVPLRRGRPDVTRREGRAVIRDVLRGKLKIRGMITHQKLMRQLQELLSVV